VSQQIVIKSTDPSDTSVDIEEKLEKAMTAIQAQRENKQFSDLFLRDKKKEADEVVSAVFASMIEEINDTLSK